MTKGFNDVKEIVELVINIAYGTDPRHSLLAEAAAAKIVYNDPIPWSLGTHFGRGEVDEKDKPTAITKEAFEAALGYKIPDAHWDTIINRNRADYFPTARDAVPINFEPVVPCQYFETRPCVDLSLDEKTTYRKERCDVGKCVRFPEKE